MRRVGLAAVALMLLLLGGCGVAFEGVIRFPSYDYVGAIVSHPDYTLRVKITEYDARTGDRYLRYERLVDARSVSSPLYLDERYYTFEATHAFSGQYYSSRSMHVSAIRGTQHYNGEVYDWLVMFGR